MPLLPVPTTGKRHTVAKESGAVHLQKNTLLAQVTKSARADHIWCSRATVMSARDEPDSQSARPRNMQSS